MARNECLLPRHAVSAGVRLSGDRRHRARACPQAAAGDIRRDTAGQRHRRDPLGRQDRRRRRPLGAGARRRAGRLLQQERHGLQSRARRSRPFRRSAFDELRDRLRPRHLSGRVHRQRASLPQRRPPLSHIPVHATVSVHDPQDHVRRILESTAELKFQGQESTIFRFRSSRRTASLVAGSLNRIHKPLRTPQVSQGFKP